MSNVLLSQSDCGGDVALDMMGMFGKAGCSLRDMGLALGDLSIDARFLGLLSQSAFAFDEGDDAPGEQGNGCDRAEFKPDAAG